MNTAPSALQGNFDATALDAAFELGMKLHQQGRLDEAEPVYRAILQQDPDDVATRCLLALLALQTGRTALALDLTGQAIALDAEYPEAHHTHGLALRQLQRVEDAVASFDRAIALKPDYVEAIYQRGLANAALGRFEAALADYDQAALSQPYDAALHTERGNALHALRRHGEAVVSYNKAVTLRADYAPAFYNRGLALQDQGQSAEAVASYSVVVALQPDHPETYNNRGIALRALKRTEEALADYDRAIALRPDYAAAFSNRGNALRELQRPEQALASFDRAIALQPGFPEAHNNRGIILREMGQSEAALASFDRAIALKPDYAEAHCNRGSVLQMLHRVQEAVPSYEAAIRLQPDFAVAHENYGMCLLQLGDFLHGWREYEWRWKTPLLSSSARKFHQRLWLGDEAIADATILLYAEQGLGDTLQFCRFARLVAERGARVVLKVQRPLVRLLDSLGVGKVTAFDDPSPDFDRHCPLLSLPLALRIGVDTIPAYSSYLQADPAAAAAWRQRLAALPGRRVGLVWAGEARRISPDIIATDRRRSMTLDRFAPLGDVPGVSFVSLQKGPPAAQARPGPTSLRLFDVTDELNDFADTAALVEALDLVVSVDTSVAHLAGALGKPVWILNRFDACWRWLLDRTDSPWYPSARLFRQPSPGDWDSVIAEVAAALRGWAGTA